MLAPLPLKTITPAGTSDRCGRNAREPMCVSSTGDSPSAARAPRAGDAGDRLSASVSTSAATADQLRQQADRLNAATMSLAESADLAARMFTNLRIEIEKLEGRAT